MLSFVHPSLAACAYSSDSYLDGPFIALFYLYLISVSTYVLWSDQLLLSRCDHYLRMIVASTATPIDFLIPKAQALTILCSFCFSPKKKICSETAVHVRKHTRPKNLLKTKKRRER